MMLELSALSWIEYLYGADTGSLTLTPYESDIEAIVDEVLAYNQQFVPAPGSLAMLGLGGLLFARRLRA
jgi:hypothetical protein